MHPRSGHYLDGQLKECRYDKAVLNTSLNCNIPTNMCAHYSVNRMLRNAGNKYNSMIHALEEVHPQSKHMSYWLMLCWS